MLKSITYLENSLGQLNDRKRVFAIINKQDSTTWVHTILGRTQGWWVEAIIKKSWEKTIDIGEVEEV